MRPNVESVKRGLTQRSLFCRNVSFRLLGLRCQKRLLPGNCSIVNCRKSQTWRVCVCVSSSKTYSKAGAASLRKPLIESICSILSADQTAANNSFVCFRDSHKVFTLWGKRQCHFSFKCPRFSSLFLLKTLYLVVFEGDSEVSKSPNITRLTSWGIPFDYLKRHIMSFPVLS